jgi:hypothetical protein
VAWRADRRSESRCRKHRGPGRLQPSEGQHDHLTCIPRSRPCQSRHRRPPPPRHGCRTALRYACRMVAAAPYTWSFPTIRIDTEFASRRATFGFGETGFCGQGTKASRSDPSLRRRSRSRTARPRKTQTSLYPTAVLYLGNAILGPETEGEIQALCPGTRTLETGRPRWPRDFGAFCEVPGKVSILGTAWWARQDSNLQPDRYERSALTIELRARTCDATFYQRARAVRNLPLLPLSRIGRLRPSYPAPG